MLVNIDVHRHYSQIELLTTLFLWKLALGLLIPDKLVLRVETFMSEQGPLSPVPECMTSSSIGTYLPPLARQ